MYNKHGRIVSRSKHTSAKREMRLKKYGYGTQKGKFGYVKLDGTRSRKRGRGTRSRRTRRRTRSRSRSHRGGSALQPASVDASYMIKDVVPQHFTPLDRALTGGRRRRRRSYRGGLALGGVLNPANAMASGIDGQGITNYGASGSNSVQVAAGMAGGRRRRRRHRGGTGKPHFAENAALAGALGAA